MSRCVYCFVWAYWCCPSARPHTTRPPLVPHWDAGRQSLIPGELIRISGEERAPDRVRTNCTAELHSDAFRSVFMSVWFGCMSVHLSGWQMRDWPAQALDNYVGTATLMHTHVDTHGASVDPLMLPTPSLSLHGVPHILFTCPPTPLFSFHMWSGSHVKSCHSPPCHAQIRRVLCDVWQ